MKKLTTILSVSLLLTLASSAVQAAIIVNPDDDGSTNVTAPSTWTETKDVNIGYSSAGTLLIDQSDSVVEEVVSKTITIGNQSGSTGIATISGAGTTWNNGVWGEGDSDISYGFINVGASGAGTMTINSGATVTTGRTVHVGSSSAGGSLVVTGFGTRLDIGVNYDWGKDYGTTNGSRFVIGNGGVGSMEISDGATVTNTLYTYIGSNTSSTGTVLVTDPGTSWHSGGSIGVSYRGSGQLDIQNGASVTTDAWFDMENNGVMNVTGSDTVAHAVECIWLAYSTGSVGTLNVSDYGRVSTDGFIQIGRGGSGSSLNLNNGIVETGSLLTDPNDVTGTGVIKTNGLCTDGLDLVFDSNAAKTQTITGFGANSGVTINLEMNENTSRIGAGYNGVGSMSISNGVEITSTVGYMGYKAGADGTVNVSGTDSTWAVDSSVYVGVYGSGTLNITDGGLVSAGGGLAIDYDGGTSVVNMSFGGMLAFYSDADDDDVGDDLSGSIDDFLDAIVGDGSIKCLDESTETWFTLNSSTSTDEYELEYITSGDLAGYTMLTVSTQRLPGDANRDGKVDGSDVTILANNWQKGVGDGVEATWAMGDFNDDGKVDGSDVTILANNWQEGVGGMASAVPEPGTMALLLTALLALGAFRRVRK